MLYSNEAKFEPKDAYTYPSDGPLYKMRKKKKPEKIKSTVLVPILKSA